MSAARMLKVLALVLIPPSLLFALVGGLGGAATHHTMVSAPAVGPPPTPTRWFAPTVTPTPNAAHHELVEDARAIRYLATAKERRQDDWAVFSMMLLVLVVVFAGSLALVFVIRATTCPQQ